MIDKLLSHRLRGFDRFEHSRSALKNACNTEVQFLEVDTRVTKDKRIFLHHDPRTCKLAGPSLLLAETPSHIVETLSYDDGHHLLLLDDALDIFRNRAGKKQCLCIDIKDWGFEEQHLALVRTTDLEDRVCFVSWIPQVLTRLWELGTRSPLIFSHVNLLRFGVAGKWFESILENAIFNLGRLVFMGKNTADKNLTRRKSGFQHAYIACTLPESLAHILRKSGGGICVHKKVLCPRLTAYCNENGIKLWIFSVETRKQFLDLAADPGVDVIFHDNAPLLF